MYYSQPKMAHRLKDRKLLAMNGSHFSSVFDAHVLLKIISMLVNNFNPDQYLESMQ
jgi:hypothetical protein